MDATRFHAAPGQLASERLGDYQVREARLGPFTVAFESIPAGFPPHGPALYQGLPDHACQVPHWGYVFRGLMRFIHSDGSEQVVAGGEAYYVPPGHRSECLVDAETVEFSPTEDMDRHNEIVSRNIARLAITKSPA